MRSQKNWEEREARWYDDPGTLVSNGCCTDGLPCEWLPLQSEVACHRGGGAIMHRLLHLPYPRDECKIDKGSLLCAERGKTHSLPQQLLMPVWGKFDLITGSVKHPDCSPFSNLHINVAQWLQSAMFTDGWGWGDCFLITFTLCCSGGVRDRALLCRSGGRKRQQFPGGNFVMPLHIYS